MGIKCVHTVMHRGDEYDVMNSFARNGQARNVKRLREIGPSTGCSKIFPESIAANRNRRQEGFVGILAGARIVVVSR
jgi:hypothetical protein